MQKGGLREGHFLYFPQECLPIKKFGSPEETFLTFYRKWLAQVTLLCFMQITPSSQQLTPTLEKVKLQQECDSITVSKLKPKRQYKSILYSSSLWIFMENANLLQHRKQTLILFMYKGLIIIKIIDIASNIFD